MTLAEELRKLAADSVSSVRVVDPEHQHYAEKRLALVIQALRDLADGLDRGDVDPGGDEMTWDAMEAEAMGLCWRAVKELKAEIESEGLRPKERHNTYQACFRTLMHITMVRDRMAKRGAVKADAEAGDDGTAQADELAADLERLEQEARAALSGAAAGATGAAPGDAH